MVRFVYVEDEPEASATDGTRKPFKVQARELGLPPFTKVNELIALLECPRCNPPGEAPGEYTGRMKHEFTAILERDDKWWVGFCPEVPGANGQGLTRGDCLQNLAEAVKLILEDRLEDGLRGVPPEAVREVLTIA